MFAFSKRFVLEFVGLDFWILHFRNLLAQWMSPIWSTLSTPPWQRYYNIGVLTILLKKVLEYLSAHNATAKVLEYLSAHTATGKVLEYLSAHTATEKVLEYLSAHTATKNVNLLGTHWQRNFECLPTGSFVGGKLKSRLLTYKDNLLINTSHKNARKSTRRCARFTCGDCKDCINCIDCMDCRDCRDWRDWRD